MDDWLNRLALKGVEWRERWGLGQGMAAVPVLLLVLGAVQLGLAWHWGRERPVAPVEAAPGAARGAVLVGALATVARGLTDKPGGYLANDLLPPGLLLDDIPAWERGALQSSRDLLHVLGQGSAEVRPGGDPDLADAERAFSVAPDAWAMPSAEAELVRGGAALQRFGRRLGPGGTARLPVDEVLLRRWLETVDGRLEQSAVRLNAALPAPVAAAQPVVPETSWWEIDDVFYEARGSAWALLHLLRAAEIEFAPLLERRHADLSLRAAIHELAATQQPVWSPVILNGSGFGLSANHSLVLANYLARAQADLADVRQLLATAP